MKQIYIAQGEFAVADTDHPVISAILGSCVACCLWDPIARVGGMNHILLSSDNPRALDAAGTATNMMELVLNGMFRKGAMKSRITAKVFGGADMHLGMTSTGSTNGTFVTDFLCNEAIKIVAQDLGGQRARRVEFQAASGRARLKYVADHDVQPKIRTSVQMSQGNDLELF